MSVAALIARIRATTAVTEADLVAHLLHRQDVGANFWGQDIYPTYFAIGQLYQPESIVEIGTRFGYSLQSLVAGSGKVKHVYCYDDESDTTGSNEYVRDRLQAPGLNALCLTKVNSQHILSLRVPHLVDLVHLDAQNTASGCYHDCVLALECLKSGGILLIDDITSGCGRVKEGADRFCAEFNQISHFVPTLRGMYVIVYDRSAAEINVRAFYQDHDYAEKDYIVRTVKPGMTVLDIGGNHGEYTWLFQRLVGIDGRVIVFEPDSQGCAYMRAMVLTGNTVLEPLALCATEGESDYYQFAELACWGLNSLRPPRHNVWHSSWTRNRTKVDTFDRYCLKRPLHAVDFLKLDIEGGELDFFKGAHTLLTQFRPPILCELLDARTMDFGYHAVEIVRYLEQFGYEWFLPLEGGELQPVQYTPGLLCHQQLVALPKQGWQG